MKKIINLTCIIMTIVTLIIISSTYAKYVSEAFGEFSKEVNHKWKIKVNTLDISNPSEETYVFTAKDAGYVDSDTTTVDKIAPGTSAYFDVEIDPTGTEVAIRYDITLDVDGKLSDSLVFSSAEDTISSQDLIKTGESTYTGTISLTNVLAGTKSNARLYVTWENNEANNEQDTIEGTTKNNTTSFPVKVVVSQYMGEVITAVE